MNVLCETDQLIFEYDYEMAWLRMKSTGEVLLEDHFFGDIACGLIDVDGNWAVGAGDHLSLWTPTKSKQFKPDGFGWVHSIRVKDHDKIEILIDPWGDHSAIWQLDLDTFTVVKMRDFDDYKGTEFSENVIW